MMSVKLNDIAILNIRGVYNCCIINGISKSKAVNLQPILDLNKKGGKIMAFDDTEIK